MNKIKKKLRNLLTKNNDEEIASSSLEYLYDIIQSSALDKMQHMDINDLSFLSIEYNNLENQFEQATSILKNYGIVLIKNAISEKLSDDVFENFKKIQKDFKSSDRLIRDQVTETYYIDSEGLKFKTYQEKANYSKTIFSIRNGADKGMIDVFNYDYIDKKNSSNLRKVYENPRIVDLINSASEKKYSPKNLNIYYNQDIQNTRGFHVDAYSKGKIKAFIYLTDVKDISYGPYSYVIKSNTDSEAEKLNKTFAKLSDKKHTEAFCFKIENAYPILGTKGTLVISDQAGIHRGHPQAKERERMVAVMNYEYEKE
ncbi:hypothetical protein APR41_08020 [Salegentibacter salinarum]|uniref:Phytanoyl-CoA dioxygenase n=1 Tax=Salegentibacter salinarum TaxID=447422 RepID=A0A2N0TPT7_9FLAO|nr:hypothetical protein [Salegentibacter salinarum]PKD16743.1 hypothetical protein APR41_08020 [Salegentibacter salinarum]SKB59777.1 hypothetical protein SAMN05660903_01588 [Salegentibacter salinarum]